MMRTILASMIALAMSVGSAVAQVTCPGTWPPANLTGGTTASANDVMNNFNYLYNCLTGIAFPSTPGSGFVNKLRNGTFVSWPNGVSGTMTVGPTGAAAISANGWAVLPPGARGPGPQATAGANGAPQSLKVTGATSVTGVTVGQRIESADAAALASKRVTFQLAVYNGTGGAITPTLATRYAGSADVWTSPVNDLAATNLQPCASGVWTTVAYAFDVAANAVNGYEVKIDFGTSLGANTKYVQLSAADLRATPGVSVGLSNTPQPPELPFIQAEIARSARYYQSTYDNGVAPGAASNSGMVGISYPVNPQWGGSMVFRTAMRAAPSVRIFDGAGNANAASSWNGTWVNNQGSSAAVVLASTTGLVLSPPPGSAGGNLLWHWVAYADFW
jgi:hypothetical protein